MMTEKGGFVRCPFCGSKLIKTMPDTQAQHLPAWCRKCKREILIDIVCGQSFQSQSPGPSD